MHWSSSAARDQQQVSDISDMGSASSQPQPTQPQDVAVYSDIEEDGPDQEPTPEPQPTQASFAGSRKRKASNAVGEDGGGPEEEPKKKKAPKHRGRPRDPTQLVKHRLVTEDTGDDDGDGEPVGEVVCTVLKRKRTRKKRRRADDHMLEIADGFMLHDTTAVTSNRGKKKGKADQSPKSDNISESAIKASSSGNAKHESNEELVESAATQLSDKKQRRKKKKKKQAAKKGECRVLAEDRSGSADPPGKRSKSKRKSSDIHQASVPELNVDESQHVSHGQLEASQPNMVDRNKANDRVLQHEKPKGRKPRKTNDDALAQPSELHVRHANTADLDSVDSGQDAPPSRPKCSVRGAPQIGRNEKIQLPSPVSDGPSKGAFTAAERAALDDVFDYTVQTNKQYKSAADLMRQIADWKRLSDFKVEAEMALPNRPKPAIRKACQRRFTLAQRGAWTKEEDEILRKTYAENPDKWVEIGALTDRRPGDCKDRWRNILQFDGKQEAGPWSALEEAELARAVESCIKAMIATSHTKEGQKLPSSRDELEMMVDWKTVQKRLDNKRSAKRCREKWQQLKRNGTADQLEAKAKSQSPEVLRKVYNQKSKNQRRVETAFAAFEPGDYFDVLNEIYTAIGDPEKLYQHESTVWSIVSQKNPNSHFSGALRRRAYYAALEHYTGESVRKATTVAGKAQAITNLMVRWAEKEGTTVEKLKRGIDASHVIAGREQRRKVANKAAHMKSAELVVDSEEEEEEEEEDTVMADDGTENDDRSQDKADVDDLADGVPANQLNAVDETESDEEPHTGDQSVQLSEDEGEAEGFAVAASPRSAPIRQTQVPSPSGCESGESEEEEDEEEAEAEKGDEAETESDVEEGDEEDEVTPDWKAELTPSSSARRLSQIKGEQSSRESKRSRMIDEIEMSSDNERFMASPTLEEGRRHRRVLFKME